MSNVSNLGGERDRLDAVSKVYDPAHDFDRWFQIRLGELLQPLVRGKSVLDVGCAMGVMTAWLAEVAASVDMLDGSEAYIEAARNEAALARPHVRFFCSLFEEFVPDRSYEVVSCSHVLEHVIDPVDLLRRMKSWLAPDGVVIACVPNALSAHRLLGVEMGLSATPYELSERDKWGGHRRVYDAQTFSQDIHSAGLVHGPLKGIMLKPFPNAQMTSLPESIVQGLLRVGSLIPNHASEIYYECRPA
jgi:ubiquinone/menaquinone biosynthesis C-methylase UbiE